MSSIKNDCASGLWPFYLHAAAVPHPSIPCRSTTADSAPRCLRALRWTSTSWPARYQDRLQFALRSWCLGYRQLPGRWPRSRSYRAPRIDGAGGVQPAYRQLHQPSDVQIQQILQFWRDTFKMGGMLPVSTPFRSTFRSGGPDLRSVPSPRKQTVVNARDGHLLPHNRIYFSSQATCAICEAARYPHRPGAFSNSSSALRLPSQPAGSDSCLRALPGGNQRCQGPVHCGV